MHLAMMYARLNRALRLLMIARPLSLYRTVSRAFSTARLATTPTLSSCSRARTQPPPQSSRYIHTYLPIVLSIVPKRGNRE